MCKHVINSQVYIQAPCCNKWVECSECHDEMFPDHQFKYEVTLRFTCKPCRKRFDRTFNMFSEADKYCNFCGVKWYMPGVTPESKMFDESKAVLKEGLESILDPTNAYFNQL